ncbi:MAG: HlyD family secretion protein [Acidobacteria bacterium]|nr:HlyD family secretion protein [Acidobacteriota bacterium]
MTDEHDLSTGPAQAAREEEGADRGRRRPLAKRVASGIVLVGLLIAAVFFGKWVVWRFGHVTTDAAYIKADIAHVAPEVPGKILSIEVKEGQRVTKGCVLLRIDPSEYDRKVGEAEAALAQVIAVRDRHVHDLQLARRKVPAVIDAARAGLAAAKTQVAKADANKDHWEKQWARFKRLLHEKAIARSRFEEVRTAWTAAVSGAAAARAEVRLARARLAEAKAARAKIASAASAVAEAEKGIARAREVLSMAKLARSWCDVRAPISGLVARIMVKPGDFATPGRPMVGLYNPATRYVEARFEETKLRYLRDGKRVELTVDALPGTRLTGHVVLMAPASSAEFALIPRDITAGEFTKVTQRVPIKIRIDDIEKYPEIVPGLSVEVAVSKRSK